MKRKEFDDIRNEILGGATLTLIMESGAVTDASLLMTIRAMAHLETSITRLNVLNALLSELEIRKPGVDTFMEKVWIRFNKDYTLSVADRSSAEGNTNRH